MNIRALSVLFSLFFIWGLSPSQSDSAAKEAARGDVPEQVIQNPMEFEAYVRDNPRSYLTRGCRAYEKISGTPYFYRDEGRTDPTRYHPRREIPRWPRFISRFSRHPGADDAAYRLGRCLEIDGKPIRALSWFQEALVLPDGDMTYDAKGRAVFLLDVILEDQTLEKALEETGSESLRNAIRYSRAVRLARRGRWKDASADLKSLMEGEINKEKFAFYLGDFDGFIDELHRQEETWSKAADLQERIESTQEPEQQAELLYRLGSLLYHDELIFYNHLWEGQRTGYLFFGHALPIVMKDKQSIEKYREYLWVHNNYLQAMNLFIRTRDSKPSADLDEKVRFSIGMCLYRANYGYEMKLLWPLQAWHEKITEEFRRFAELFPSSPMADDALFMVGVYGRDKSAMERILSDYPEGDKREEAKQYLETFFP